MIDGKETPEAALEHLRSLSWAGQMRWIIGILFSLQAQLEAYAKVANHRTGR